MEAGTKGKRGLLPEIAKEKLKEFGFLPATLIGTV